MVLHVYSCLLTGIIPVQIHTGIITWNRTGIFKLIHVPGISGKQGLIVCLVCSKNRLNLHKSL